MADRPILFRAPMVRRLLRFAIDVSALYCAWAIQFACTGSYAAALLTTAAVALYGCWCFYDGYKVGGGNG